MSTTPYFPLSPIEKVVKTHAILSAVGFLILLPVGALIARYARNFTAHWFPAHMVFQFVFTGPIIWAGWRKGQDAAEMLGMPDYEDRHQKIGLTLLILYIIQVTFGFFIHFVKMPSLFGGHRPPQNYVHILLGIAILALAAYQVHHGMWTEWLLVDGHDMPESAKNAWMALVVIFWVLYGLGLAFVPKQLKQERMSRASQKGKLESPTGPS